MNVGLAQASRDSELTTPRELTTPTTVSSTPRVPGEAGDGNAPTEVSGGFGRSTTFPGPKVSASGSMPTLSVLDSLKASTAAPESLPRSASGRKRLGWGQGLARLNSTPSSLGVSAGPHSTRSEALYHQGQQEVGTPVAMDVDLSYSAGSVKVKLEQQFDAQQRAQMDAQRIQAEIKEKQDEQKKILSQLDDVDLSISNLERELTSSKRECEKLEAEETFLEKQIKSKSKSLSSLEARRRKHLEKHQKQTKKEEKQKQKQKRPAIVREQPFVGIPYDRKDLVTSFCRENKARALQSDSELQGCMPEDLQIKCYNSKHYQLSEEEEEEFSEEEGNEMEMQLDGVDNVPYNEIEHNANDVHFDRETREMMERNRESHAKCADAMSNYLKRKREDVLGSYFDLGLQYLKHRERWLQELRLKKRSKTMLANGEHGSGSRDGKGSHGALLSRGSALGSRDSLHRDSPRDRGNPKMMTGNFVWSEYEEMRIIHRLQAAEKMKTLTRVPNMILLASEERRWRKFDTKNGLITSEEAENEMEEEKIRNIWSPRERRIFLEKYQQFPKDFTKIASFLEHRTTADCLVFYYKNQKSEEFAAIRRKHQMKKRRLYSEAKRMAITMDSASEKSKDRGREKEKSSAGKEDKTLKDKDKDKDRSKAKAKPKPKPKNPSGKQQGQPGNSKGGKQQGQPKGGKQQGQPGNSKGVKQQGQAQQKQQQQPQQQQQSPAPNAVTGNLAALQQQMQILLANPMLLAMQQALFFQQQQQQLQQLQQLQQQTPNPTATATATANPNPNASASAQGAAPEGGAPVEVQKRQISYWTQEEKDTFMTTFKQHGRDWQKLVERIPGKTVNQIKTFYQNYKQKLGLDQIDPQS